MTQSSNFNQMNNQQNEERLTTTMKHIHDLTQANADQKEIISGMNMIIQSLSHQNTVLQNLYQHSNNSSKMCLEALQNNTDSMKDLSTKMAKHGFDTSIVDTSITNQTHAIQNSMMGGFGTNKPQSRVERGVTNLAAVLEHGNKVLNQMGDGKSITDGFGNDNKQGGNNFGMGEGTPSYYKNKI